MNHMHDFYHMKVDGFVCDSDDVDSIDNDVDQLVSKIRMQFSAEGSPSHTYKQGLFYCVSGDLEALQEF